MKTCRSVEILSRVLPFKSWKGGILERHAGRCPSCLAGYADRNEVRPFVIEPNAISPSERAWMGVEAGIRHVPPKPIRSASLAKRLWKPVVGLAAVSGALWLIVVASRPPQPDSAATGRPKIEDFRIDSVEAMGRPAQALIYQPRDSGITLIWVQ